jgi:predicted transcriptional regulator of viral defense system
MASLSILEIYRTLQIENIALLTVSDLRRRFRITQANTAYKTMQRLVAKGLLTRVQEGVYQRSDRPVHDFVLANAMVTPSYVSLESALSRYGILSQAPMIVTSVTARKGRTMETRTKTFEYAHLAPHLFTGYIKEADYVIATPTKALFDAVYLAAKGARSVPVDELDLTAIDKKAFAGYCGAVRAPQLAEYLKAHPII